VRGFDYYTGIVFEIFDTNPINPRALFGGGRYDDLLSLFGNDKVSAVGFGMGDVTIRDFLESRNLLKPYKSTTKIYLAPLSRDFFFATEQLADDLRNQKVSVAIDYTDKKLTDKIKKADKDKIPLIVVVGEDEIKNNSYKIKNLHTSNETILPAEKIADFVK
jgi:histidyl-tRNA synthetase